MRKEIQDHPGGNAELFAEQERVGVFVEAFTIHHDNQLVHASVFKKFPNLVAAEHADEFQTPDVMTLDGSGKLMGRVDVPYHRDVTDIQSPVLGDFPQNDSIRNKKDVVDDQHQQKNDSVRGIRIHKGNQNRHHEPGKTYRPREAADLDQGWERRFGIHGKQGQQERPGWKDDCKEPEIYINGHDRMPLQFKEQTEAV